MGLALMYYLYYWLKLTDLEILQRGEEQMKIKEATIIFAIIIIYSY